MPPDDRPAILFLTKGADAASTRHRALAFFPALEAAGFRPVHLSTRGGLGHEVQLLRAARQAVVTVVLRRTFGGPFRAALRRLSRRLVFDFDDAVYRRPGGDSAGRLRGFRAMVQRSDEVWAGNLWLGRAALDASSRGPVQVLPTVLDPAAYTPRAAEQRDPHRLVWIGSSSTRPYLEAILPDLEAAAERIPGLSLRIVADFSLRSEHLVIEATPWAPETEAESLATAGIGIAPLADDEWARGKCGFKLLQYMAAGLPTVCDPVGANGQIVLDGETGFHVTPERGWPDAIAALCGDTERAAAMGQAGRTRVELDYGLERAAAMLVARLEALGARG
ncbi:MAG: glycosyltransferase [Planctomycetota bacterium]